MMDPWHILCSEIEGSCGGEKLKQVGHEFFGKKSMRMIIFFSLLRAKIFIKYFD